MEVARWMIAIVAVYNYGGILFDAVLPKTAAMHQGNPAWPPHAKFHNAQTMMLGLLLGSLALVVLFAVHPVTFPLFLIAAAVAGAYFFAMVLAQFFPRVLWVDPEFEGVVPRRFGLNPQQFVTYVLCAFWTVAVALAVVRA